MTLTLTTLTLAGLLPLTGCGAGAASDASYVAAFEQVAGQAPAPAAAGETRHPAARTFLRKNTLHGEITVEGKDGPKTVVVQRGSVTAVDARSLSVKSSDGFTLTWTIDDKVKVVQDRKKAETGAVKVGTQVGVAGARDGEATTARLVRIG